MVVLKVYGMWIWCYDMMAVWVVFKAVRYSGMERCCGKVWVDGTGRWFGMVRDGGMGWWYRMVGWKGDMGGGMRWWWYGKVI